MRGLVAVGLLLFAAQVQGAPCAGFTDVDDTSAFCANVAWAKNRGVTLGCAATLYCPGDPVTRLQMAAFVSRLDRVLSPTIVDATGRAVGPLQLGVSAFSGLAMTMVTVRFRGQPYLLVLEPATFGAIPGQPPYKFQRGGVYFELPNCAGAMTVVDTSYMDVTGRPAVVFEDSDGALNLLAAKLGPGAHRIVESSLRGGACVNEPFVTNVFGREALGIIGDIGAVYTEPFVVQ